MAHTNEPTPRSTRRVRRRRALVVAATGLVVGLGAAGTAVVAHMHRPPGAPWVVRWTNAGHPAPLLLRPDGRTELLADHDALFGFAITDGLTRTDHELVVEPGSTLFLYSDGLVERPGSDIDETTCPDGQVRKGGLARWPIY